VVGSTVFTVCATLAWTPTEPKGNTVNHELILTIDMGERFTSEIVKALRDTADIIEAEGVPDEPIGLLDHSGNTIAVLRERKPFVHKPQASCVTHGSVMPCNCFQAAPTPKAAIPNGTWWVSALVNSVI
jgi:hypothetical protein